MSFSSPLPSKDGKKLFVVGALSRGELTRYDTKSAAFVPFLSGISADSVSFSRDGQWVTYVSFPEGTLWRSKSDGSQRIQLTYPPLSVRLPSWSPDGQQIVFYALSPGREAEAVHGFGRRRNAARNDTRGLPRTNGTYLVARRNKDRLRRAVQLILPRAIRMLDVKTNQISSLP